MLTQKSGLCCSHPLNADGEGPAAFTYPFCYEPHPLAVAAAEEVQHYLRTMDISEGKMFGVLVVKSPDASSHYSFLAAYSGLLDGRNDWPWFVPPVFDAQQPDGHFKQTERLISDINREIDSLEATGVADVQTLARITALKEQRKSMSEELQHWLFRQYRFLNANGEAKDLVTVWQDYHCSPRIRNKYPFPPGGTGDCCAPKLLQHAYLHGLRPVCMAEFWWGPSPKSEVRHHRQFYPACRGKCKPVLTWMLQGLEVDADPETLGFPRLDIETVYEDETVLVVNKPSGLLSVPGRIEKYSVSTILEHQCPEALLVHRLDMGTSGLLVAAKTLDAYHDLQQQFVKHVVKKRYVALLEGASSGCNERMVALLEGQTVRVRLPLFADPMNRPRQTVDYNHGKTAVTDCQLVGMTAGRPRVVLFPHTGRTHQLRLHCAHADGLGCPIVGDELYGTRLPCPLPRPVLRSSGYTGASQRGALMDRGETEPPLAEKEDVLDEGTHRLMLHAEAIELLHPVTGRWLKIECPPPF